MLATSLGIAAVDIFLTEYLKWQEIKMRDATWKPGPETKAEFIAFIQSDTAEKIQDEVAGEQGKTWDDREPPQPS